MDSSGQAEVAELADAQASGACASQGRGGSNPPFRTTFPSNSRGYEKVAAMTAALSDRFVSLLCHFFQKTQRTATI